MITNHDSHTKAIYPVYNLFMDHQIELVYHGSIDSDIADALINIFEHFLYNKDAPVKIQKRAFYILVEALQNVVRHQAMPNPPPSGGSPASLLFQYLNGHFVFTLKNLVNDERIPEITKKIDSLNALDKNELNKHYKKILKNEVLSDKGGAGLGLIEIARKSENIISYEFLKAEKGLSWFFFSILVADKEKEDSVEPAQGLEVARELHRLLDGNRIWFVLREEYPAIFPQGLSHHVTTVLQCSSSGDHAERFRTLLEPFSGLCQAVSHIQLQEDKRPCLVFFVRDENSLSMYTGMPVTEKSSGKVVDFFNKLFLPTPEGEENNVTGEKEWKNLKRLTTLLPRPPRIILQQASPSQKFVILKFTF